MPGVLHQLLLLFMRTAQRLLQARRRLDHLHHFARGAGLGHRHLTGLPPRQGAHRIGHLLQRDGGSSYGEHADAGANADSG